MDGTGLEGRGERIWGNMGGYGGIYMGKYGGVCVNKGVDVTGLEGEREGNICEQGRKLDGPGGRSMNETGWM